MEQKVLYAIKKNNYFDKQETLIVGVSGGPDSLALLHLLNKNKFNVIAAHVDHMLRGEESREDLEFVKDFCSRNNITFIAKSIEVGKYALEKGISTQIAARECRYNFFKEVLEKFKSKKLVLAHHGDDQIETIIMRLVRGSTLKGISGIRDIRNFGDAVIIRPFLNINKSLIHTYCNENNLRPRIDKSNEKVTYTRNRFRKYILPFFYSENPNVDEHFVRFGNELAEDDKLLQELTICELNKVLKIKDNTTYIIDIERFLQLPIPLQRRGINLILNYLYSFSETHSQTHIYKILSMIKEKSSNFELHLPDNLIVKKTYNNLIFSPLYQKSTYSGQNYEIKCCNIGTYDLPNGKKLEISYAGNENHKEDLNKYYYYGNLDENPIIIRNVLSGDKITFESGTGSKKLTRIFIDEKVPFEDRSNWPVVVNSNGRIIWIPLLRKIKIDNHKSDNIYLLTYI